MGDCPRDQECVEVAQYQCACSQADTRQDPTTTVTITTTTLIMVDTTSTSTTIYQPSASDLLDDIVLTTTTLIGSRVTLQPSISITTLQLIPDSDGDGVFDPDDECPDTPEDTSVFGDGCGCHDSDGGKKPYADGSTSNAPTSYELPPDAGMTYTPTDGMIMTLPENDECINSTTVTEYYCNDSQVRDIAHLDCPNGCADGICVCNDGDGGFNPEVRGMFSVEIGGSKGDETTTTLKKFKASNDYVLGKNGQKVFISNTKFAGAQLKKDVARANVNMKAPVMHLPMSDYCISDTVLREFYCDLNGNIISEDYVCPDTCENGTCITVPNVRYLFVPIRWQGNQASFDADVQTQIDFFIDAIPLKDCPDEVLIDKVALANGLDAGDFNCYTNSIEGHVDGLGINRADYDVVIGLTDADWCSPVGRSDGADTVWGFTDFESVTAHELGHIYDLEDEYCSNQAGATDGRCNDGDSQNDGSATGDINYLKGSLIEDCPPDGSDDSTGNPCCTFYDDLFWDAWRNCSTTTYGICCLGNKNSEGGRAIMSFADVELMSPGPRAFDELSKAHLATKPILQCGNPNKVLFTLILGVFMDMSTISGGGGAPEDTGSQDGQQVGYVGNVTADKVVVVELDVGKDGKVSENALILRDGRPTLTYNEDGEYNLMVFDGSGKMVWSAMFDLYYDYYGPRVFGNDYSNITYDSKQVGYKIPYYPGMKDVKLYKNGKLIYEKGMDFCVKDGVCGVTETVETCPSDCRKDALDKICDPSQDGICDPDCLKKADPDCGRARAPRRQEPLTDPQEPTTCIPFLPGILVLMAGLFISTPLYYTYGKRL